MTNFVNIASFSEMKILNKRMAEKLLNKKIMRVNLWLILYITIIISVFDFKPDLNIWLLEIGRNFVLVNSIAWTFYFLSVPFGLDKLPVKFKKVAIGIIFSAVVSVIGGSIGWLINHILFGFNITHPLIFFIMIFLVTLFTAFAFRSYLSWKEANEALARKKEAEQRLIRLKTDAELDAIRAKLNPHFLFNTINSIMSLIHSDSMKAEEMLQKLSDLLRIIHNKKEYIKLSEELEIIQKYLAIEKVRFGELLKYNITAEENTKNAEVPAMILQPLVENSLKHGISSAMGGFVSISAQKTSGENLLIKITDSGSGFELSEATGGFGLSGLKERLELIYGQAQKLEINNGNGCEICITIPFYIPE